MKEMMESLLNSKSSSLCFNKDEFMVEDFSVDRFVSECRKYASLETMQEDLGLYHKILRSAMIELINKDYADFVNLSSNLVGLDKFIRSLTSPLQNLKTEIKEIKTNLNETLDTASAMFSERAEVHRRKTLIQHIVYVLEGLEKIENLNLFSSENPEPLSPEILERIALDLNLVQFHMNKISDMKALDHKKEEIQKLAQNIEQHLGCMFLQSLSSNDVQNLLKVLRIYSVINKEREVEDFFRQTVAKPFMRKCITEENIMSHRLTKVYDDCLNFIQSSCLTLIKVTRGTKRHAEIVPGYDFLVNAVWPEIVLCFEYIAPVYVCGPGDPELFHQNFSASMKFLDQFEHYCEVQSSVRRLREHASYEQFMKKWNLDVYFQIRFQEIAGRFEKSLLQPFDSHLDKEFLNDKNAQYVLNASASLWYCLEMCWSDNIFLFPLCKNFWKLTLQLISRYIKWAYSYLKSENEELLSPVQTAILVRDVELLISQLEEFFYCVILQKLCNKNSTFVEKAFQEALKLLGEIPPLSGNLMIKSLTKQCCSYLKLITDIPRLYRKTNREVPSKPSGYVALVFSSLTEFLSETKSILSPKWKEQCLTDVTEGIVTQCMSMVSDVLTSIKKMEDSLKILKRARDKPAGQASSGTVTDDDKIRRQLALDVNHLEQLVQDTGLQIEKVKSFKALKDLVASAERMSQFQSKT